MKSTANISGATKVPFAGNSVERWLTEGSQHPLAESQPPPRSGGAILIGTRRATRRSGPRTVLLPMIASRGDPGANVYVTRWRSRFGTVRRAEGGSTTSTNVTTVDDAGMLLVGSSAPRVWVAAASASPLSVRSSFPPAVTTREVSVTSAVTAFVLPRSYSISPRPSLPGTRCGAPTAATCNAVDVDAARAAVPGDAPAITATTSP